MKLFVSDYLAELLRERKRKTILYKAATCMAVAIVFVTTYMLILPAITMSKDTYCGQEHEHVLQCYSDPEADIETSAEWEAALPDTSGLDAADSILSVAVSQLGYMESENNYIAIDENKKGYSRYGQWYGDPYGDWNEMFAMFCLSYAGADTDLIPEQPRSDVWLGELKTLEGRFKPAADYTPAPGDLVFTDTDSDGTADRTGIFREKNAEDGSLMVIEGDVGNQVAYSTYKEDDGRIIGYGLITPEAKPEEAAAQEDAAENTAAEENSVLQYNDERVSITVEPDDDTVLPEGTYLQVQQNEPGEESSGAAAAAGSMGADRFIAEQYRYSVALASGDEEVALDEEARVTFTYRPQETEYGSDMQAMISEIDESSASVLAQEPASEGSELTAVFSTDEFATYGVMLLAGRSAVQEGQYGQYDFSYNEEKDAFIKDPAYDVYYNQNSPLGTAGSFHLVGFGTVNLGTHTNGNVLANTLIAGSNFGTNNYQYELSYAVNYQSINPGSASSTDDHILVVGSGNTVTVGGNNDQVLINGTKIDKPYSIVQDTDTETAPFIDLDRVEDEIRGISERLAQVETQGLTIDFEDENNRAIILNDSDGAGFYTVTAKELQDIANFSDRKLRLKGFHPEKNGSIVINVDCTGITKFVIPDATIFIGDQEQSTNETTNFTAGKVIWNFTNAEGVEIETRQMTGMVIALGASVKISRNLNGTVVAENIKVEAESHRTDFTGDVVVPGDDHELIPAYLKIRKVDRDNISIYLEGAVFDLYRWDAGAGEYVPERSGLTYDPQEPLVISGLAFNQAYRLTEVKSPAGYAGVSTSYDFMITNKDTANYPVCSPADFSGEVFINGQTLYYMNEKMRELVIEKQWLDSDGNPIEPEVTEISVDIWRNTYTDEELTILKRSEIYQEELKITADGNWQISLKDLPASGMEAAGSSQMKVYYTYYVNEIRENDDYRISYEGNSGVASGVITIKNIKKEKFVIPKTGGPAPVMWAAGLILMAAAFLTLMRQRAGRKEGESSP